MSLLTNVLKLWRTGQYLLPADSGFMVKHLFANGEPGFAKLDFSGFAGMYQDRARTIPYTAVEQPLGSFTGLNGVTATAPADVNRGVVSARVNGFTESEFRNGVTDAPICAGLVTASTLTGYFGALTFGHDGVTISYAYKSGMSLFGVSSVLSVIIKMTDGTAPIATGQHTGSDFVFVINGAQTATASIVSLGGGYYRVSSIPTVITSNNTGVIKYQNNSPRTFKVTAYDLRPTSQANLPYQWVNTPTDYDTAGFPHYLKFNGTNTTYVTPSIDFTGTDKMTVWAGVTKLSDTISAALLELSSAPAATEGTFWINTSGAIVGDIWSGLASSVSVRTGYGFQAPAISTGVLSVAYDFAGTLRADEIKPRWNSTVPTLTGGLGADAGAGPFGNHPLYIGARAGTSSFFNGRIYSLIVRGAATPLPQIEAVETLIRQKMRLP